MAVAMNSIPETIINNAVNGASGAQIKSEVQACLGNLNTFFNNFSTDKTILI